MDELKKKEQVAEVAMEQRADIDAETPSWQEWVGSDCPEDTLANLDAVREEVTGEKRMVENSTNIIRKSRETRGQGG